jgi:hypothetical protein
VFSFLDESWFFFCVQRALYRLITQKKKSATANVGFTIKRFTSHCKEAVETQSVPATLRFRGAS